MIYWIQCFLFRVDNLYIKVTVLHSNAIYHISNVMGWVYFLAWSISFYPQMWVNYKRKSVVGLNFDFVGLNIVGFILYSFFNLGLFYIPEIQVCNFCLFIQFPIEFFYAEHSYIILL